MLSSGKLLNFYIQNYIVFFLLKSVNIFFHNKTDKNRHQRRDDWNLKWKVDWSDRRASSILVWGNRKAMDTKLHVDWIYIPESIEQSWWLNSKGGWTVAQKHSVGNSQQKPRPETKHFFSGFQKKNCKKRRIDVQKEYKWIGDWREFKALRQNVLNKNQTTTRW